ncbi:MAG: hypothetical protein R2836_01260 [Chitinophagales bacterium]
MPVNQVFGGYEGQMYMGCLLVNAMDEYTHANIALQKNLQNISIKNPIKDKKLGTAYTVNCADADGINWHGKGLYKFNM